MTEEQIDKIAFYEKQIQECSEPSEILKLYRDYRNYVAFFNPRLSLEIATRGLDYAKSYGSETEIYELLFTQANSLLLIEKYDVALDQYLSCFHYFSKTDNRIMVIKVLGSISNLFFSLELYHQSIYIINLLLNNYINPGDEELKYLFMMNLTHVYNYLHHKSIYDLVTYNEILLYLEGVNKMETQMYVKTLVLKAIFYKNNNMFDDAISLFKEIIIKNEKLDSAVLLKEVYYDLGQTYKVLGNETEMKACFKKSIEYAEKSNIKSLNQNVFHELYQYYSSKNNYKKALEYLEKYNTMTVQFEESKSRVNSKIQTLGYNTDIIFNSDWVKSLSHEVNINDQHNLYITDINDKIQKVNINDIVFIKKDKEILKIEIVLGKTIYSKMSFKDCIEKLKEIPSVNLFFETNLRNQIVNLFWMVDVDLPNKTIHLKAIDKSYLVQISKRQYALFKKFLQEYYHESNNFLK
jgi:tetratricopeptide (TPR) repeat protein